MSNNAHEVLSAISEAISAFDRVPGLLAEIERLTKVVSEKNALIGAFESEVDTLQLKIDDLRDSINSDFGYKAEIETLKQERASLQDENSVLSADLDKTRLELSFEKDTGSRLAALISLREAEIASLTAQVSDNRSLADKFKSALDKIMGNINEVTPPAPSAPEVVDSTGFPSSNEPVMANPLEGNSLPPLAPMGNPDSATDSPVKPMDAMSDPGTYYLDKPTITEPPAPNSLKPLGFSPETESALEDFEDIERRYGYWV